MRSIFLLFSSIRFPILKTLLSNFHSCKSDSNENNRQDRSTKEDMKFAKSQKVGNEQLRQLSPVSQSLTHFTCQYHKSTAFHAAMIPNADSQQSHSLISLPTPLPT